MDMETDERLEEFSDVHVAVNGTAMEEFWYVVNGHTHPKPNGEVSYSGSATASAHAIGRVTCPVDGKDTKGKERKEDIRMGFFHLHRGDAKANVVERFKESGMRLSHTQCARDMDSDADSTECSNNNDCGNPCGNCRSDCNVCAAPGEKYWCGKHRKGASLASSSAEGEKNPHFNISAVDILR